MSREPKNIKSARARYCGEDQFIGESSSGHVIVMSVGGKMNAPSPVELVLISLGGCAGSDVVSILEKKRQRVTAYEIEVRGERRDQHPRIYTSIEVIHRVRGRGIDPKAVAHAVRLSESKYCSVSAMLEASAKISSRYEIIEEEIEKT